MNPSDVLKSIEHLPYFARGDLRAFRLPEKTLEVHLSRATQQGRLYRLKRGIYTTKAFVDNIKTLNQLTAYREFLANVLVPSSYITNEYVLAKYELLTEAVFTITSITENRPTVIENDLGFFRYRNTANRLLSQFETVKTGQFQIKIANKIQALFDYLYLKKKELRIIDLQTVRELRLNLHLLSTTDFAILIARSKESKSKKLLKITSLLMELNANQ